MDNLERLQQVACRVSDIYAERFGIERDAVWHLAKLTEEMGELQAAYLKLQGQGRSDAAQGAQRLAMEDEFADVFSMLLLFARWQNVDMEAAVMRKWGKYLPDDQEPDVA